MKKKPEFNPASLIAIEESIPGTKVEAVIRLLQEDNTIPFIARYRKEITGNLDEVQIRAIQEKYNYLTELDKRRTAILASIAEQGKLTAELEAKIAACHEKATLEDLYLPYKPKRRTRATIAREKGLLPLAERILSQPPDGDPLAEGQAYVGGENEVEDAAQALALARDIVAEIVAENAEVRALVRDVYAKEGLILSVESSDESEEKSKFKDYFDYKEPVVSIPSHRFLAVRRGEREGALRVSLIVDNERLIEKILSIVGYKASSLFGVELKRAVEDGYKRLIAPSVENDVRVELKMRSDRAAVDIFAGNLENLLLASPFGAKSSIGVDPGLRTGCKCAALSATGRFVDSMTFNLVRGDQAMNTAREQLITFIRKHAPDAVAVGNGTGGREALKFVRDCILEAGLKNIVVVQVSESGASVYSASDIAAKEFPDLDLTIRGAISIARRFQDPLAELVKIDPKSIGVGQYQHDVHQPLLVRKLDDVVESCVNRVGVELNTASAQLLSRVAGIGAKLAENIVEHREKKGGFIARKQLLSVSKLGPKAFEQSAGFLRIAGAENPLDASAVHPERYSLVKKMAADMNVGISELVGNASLAEKIELSRYRGDDVGEHTLRDIIMEIKKPGRDPRDTFVAPKFRDDVQTPEDLKMGMELEGVVTNVTAFGVFVDVGVHQDGLVHISELADRFIKDPNEVVKVGDKIKVRVLDVDLDRKRISLSARSNVSSNRGATKSAADRQRPARHREQPRQKTATRKFTNKPFAELLKKH